MSDTTNCYRFALLGTTSSGKTCILAQLGRNNDVLPYRGIDLKADATKPLRYSSILLSATSKGSGQKRSEGDDWLKQAMNSIQSGKLPEATPPTRIVKDFKFKINRSDCGDFIILMSEYAGELLRLDSDFKSDSDSDSTSTSPHDKTGLPVELKEFLKTCDGLLILSEVFREGSVLSVADWSNLNDLQQFFTSLRDEKPDYPVAILFTKWDRISKKFERENFRLREEEKLGQYLQQHQEYYNRILVLVNDPSSPQGSFEQRGIRQRNQLQQFQENQLLGNIKLFPVSAFGSTQENKGQELPDPGVNSFCLVEPFVWLARCCDDLEFRRLETAWQKARRFRYILWPFGRSRQRSMEVVNSIAQKLIKRHPKGVRQEEKEFTQRIRKYKTSLFFRSLCIGVMRLFYILIILAGMVLGVDGGHYAFDTWQLKDLRQKLDAETVSPENLLQIKDKANLFQFNIPTLFAPPDSEYRDIARLASKKLNDYYQVKMEKVEGAEQKTVAREVMRVLPGTPLATEAEKILNSILQKEEDDFWKTVLDEKLSPETRLANAQKYTNTWPDGRYFSQAVAFDSSLKMLILRREADGILAEKDDNLRKEKINRFLVDHPNSPLTNELKDVLLNMKKKEEDDLWKKVQTASSPELRLLAVKTYRTAFPAGYYSIQAGELESQLIFAVQEAAFNAIISEKDERIQKNKIQRFLSKYPEGGTFANRLNDIRLNLEKKEEESFWNMVTQAENEDQKLTAVRRYLESCPTGRHLAEASKIKNDLEILRWRRELDDIEQEKNPAMRKERAEDFLKHNAGSDLSPRVRGIVAKAEIELRWNRESMNFERDKGQLDIKGIFSFLVILAEIDQKKAGKYVMEFQSLVKTRLTTVDNTKSKLEMLTEAREFIPVLKEKLSEIDTVFLTEASDAFSLQEKELLKEYDGELYSLVLAGKDAASCNNYIKEMEKYKVGRYLPQVKEYLLYLSNMNTPMDRKVSVVVNWGGASALDMNVNVVISIANQVVLREKTQMPRILSKQFTIPNAKLDDRVNFETHIVAVDNWFVRDGFIYGAGRQEFILRDLKKSEQLVLTGEKNEKDYGLSLTITLMDQEPVLPPLN